MVAKILSLLNPFKKTYRSRLFKCVSPLLMGAVLALILARPLNIYAFDNNDSIYIPNHTNGSFYTGTKVLGSYINSDGSESNSAEIVFDNLTFNMPTSFVQQYYLITNSGTPTFYNGTYDIDIANVKLHLIVNSKEYIIDPFRFNSVSTPDDDWIKSYNSYLFAYPNIKDLVIYSDFSGVGRISILYYFEIITSKEINVLKNEYNTLDRNELIYFDNYELPVKSYLNYSVTIGKDGVSNVDYDNATIDSIERNTEQIQEYHELDKSDAQQAGSDMTGFASQLDNLKNTWAILWYPIEFTNRFVEVFTGGTQAAAYQDEYTYVTGYRYNDENGFLEPIHAMSAQPQSAGSGITFPSFELMGYTIWESYTYDLSQVKEQVPEVFDAIYVIVSILEMLWFVGFLRSKYNEVFG